MGLFSRKKSPRKKATRNRQSQIWAPWEGALLFSVPWQALQKPCHGAGTADTGIDKAAANANAAQAPAESALPPLTAASAEPNAAATTATSAPAVAAAQQAASQQQPQQEQQASVRRVRYTTNLPKQKRRADKEDLIRVLNMDSPQPSISNAAGAAAYQQQAAAAAQATAAPQGNPAMPNSRAQAVRDSAALKQMMEARESGQAGTPVVTTGPLAPLTGA